MSLTACRHSAGDAACGEVVVVQDEVAVVIEGMG